MGSERRCARLKEGGREILLDVDVPSGEKFALHMKRRKTGELISF